MPSNRSSALENDVTPVFDPTKLPDRFLAFAWDNLPPRDRTRVLADGPKTAWLFGAGASHHYNLNLHGVPLPLATGFMQAFHHLPTSQGFQAHVGPLISYLMHEKKLTFPEVLRWEENIEDFMTSIEAELHRLRAKGAREHFSKRDLAKSFALPTVFNNMTFIMANVINEAQNGIATSLYHELLKFCGPEDTFITFNWDTLLDRALADSGGWTPNDGYELSFSSVLDGRWKARVDGDAEPFAQWKLLKLHGSTNWLVPLTHVRLDTLEYVSSVPRSSNVFLYWQSTLPYKTHHSRWRGGYSPTTYGYYPPNLPGDAFERKHLAAKPGYVWLKVTPVTIFSAFEEPAADGVPSSPLLITPVRQKKYDAYKTTIEKLWRQAARALKAADRLVIVGYSFPRTDTRTTGLIRDLLDANAGPREVEIVAPDADAVAARIGLRRLRKVATVRLHPMKFEEYMGTLVAGVPGLMKTAASRHREVYEWLGRIWGLGQFGR